MIKLYDLLLEYETDWEFGFERKFRWDPNSTKNEGKFRLVAPDELTEKGYYRTTKNPYTKETIKGISYVMGKRKDNNKLVIQSIVFDKNEWNEYQAQQWFNDNKHKFHFSTRQIH